MKKKLLIVGLLFLCVGLYYGYHHQKKLTKDALQNTWVNASQIKPTTVPEVVRTHGTIVATSIDVTSEISGQIKKIYFSDGATVKTGDALFELDNALYKSKVISAKAKYAFSKNKHERMMVLAKRGIVTKEALEQSEADLKEKLAEMEESDVMLQKTILKAPFAGVVGKKNVTIGDYINVGQKLVPLTDVDHLRVEYNLPEKYIGAVKLGQHIKMTSEAYRNQSIDGVVSFVSPTINPINRSIQLYSFINNKNHTLTPGIFIDVLHELNSNENVLMVPARSLIPAIEGQQVFKIVDGKAYAVTVRIGNRDHDQVQILDGLKPNDIIVTDGQEKLRNGMPVKVKL